MPFKQKLWEINQGKCGICGDAWDLPEPRPNEDGGKFGKGIVVRTYKSGQEFTATLNMVANHEGYFEFKLCPVQKGVKADQECLDRHPVHLADGSGDRWVLKPDKKGLMDVKLRLPEGLKCERCVLQWHWKCGEFGFKVSNGVCCCGLGRLCKTQMFCDKMEHKTDFNFKLDINI